MSRILLEKGKQKEFLNNIYTNSDLSWAEVARICKVCERTLRDWRREKYNMSYEALARLNRLTKISIPKRAKILPEYWNTKKAGRIGATRRYKIYGNPGTPEGRKKGGQTTQKKFSLNPEYAKKAGFIIRKEINHPTKSANLAEFISIVLGDGSISGHQVVISMNSKKDVAYGTYVNRLILKLFKIKPHVKIVKKNTLQIVATGKNLVEFLMKSGLKGGDKILQQVDIPEWIMRNKCFMINCLKGLVDTDGSIYFHTHITKGIKYRHIGLCFTNKSMPLLNSVYTIFSTLGISAKNNNKNRVSIYTHNEIKRYMSIVGSHNRKHIERFNSYKNSKII